MKKLVVTALFLFSSSSLYSYSGERFVTRTSDDMEEGSLRVVLQASCDDAGDDVIRFAKTHLPELRIVLNEPLVIPPDCQGRVTLHGSDEVGTLLDASLLGGVGKEPGDSCILNVYSDGHVIKNFGFVNHVLGSGICLFGRENTVRGNRLEDNRHGVVVADVFTGQYPQMDGSGNNILENQIERSSSDGIFVQAEGIEIVGNKVRHSNGRGVVLKGQGFKVTDNEVLENGSDGVWVHGSEGTISRNEILANGGCPVEEPFSSDSHECLFGGSGGAGIAIGPGSKNILIGGPTFHEGRNFIQYNRDGGVVVLGTTATSGHTITRNIISKNYGLRADVDLKGDGTTRNDEGDADQGPNGLLNYVDYVQTFPLVPGPYGDSRYWSWGLANFGDRVELYLVSGEDVHSGKTHGGGNNFIGQSAVEGKTFSLPSPFPAEEGWTAALSFDGAGNTSEFSLNLPFGPDADLDGLVDELETGDLQSTDPESVDTDGDGIADGIEDRNRNGVWDVDEGETAAYLADSDGDGVIDGLEYLGDPLNPDTDGDTLLDGQEDANGNGIWDGHLRETSPRLADSDGDHFSDAQDVCPSLYNPGQEPWFCPGGNP